MKSLHDGRSITLLLITSVQFTLRQFADIFVEAFARSQHCSKFTGYVTDKVQLILSQSDEWFRECIGNKQRSKHTSLHLYMYIKIKIKMKIQIEMESSFMSVLYTFLNIHPIAIK